MRTWSWWRRTLSAAAAVIAAATPLAGCDGSCDAILYNGGVALTIDGVDAASYQIELTAWDETVAVACDAAGACAVEPGAAVTLRVTLWSSVADGQLPLNVSDRDLALGPDQLRVRVRRDGVEVLATDLAPRYQPGPRGGCNADPEIEHASETLTLP